MYCTKRIAKMLAWCYGEAYDILDIAKQTFAVRGAPQTFNTEHRSGVRSDLIHHGFSHEIVEDGG